MLTEERRKGSKRSESGTGTIKEFSSANEENIATSIADRPGTRNKKSSETCDGNSIYKKVAKALRVRKTKWEVFHDDSKACPICLEQYQNGEKIARSLNPSCDHMFHLDCIADWLMYRDECALCRATFIDFDIENR